MSDTFPRIAGLNRTRESHEPRLDASKFALAGIVPTNPEWDGTHGLAQWGMDGNDKFGCCGAAATDHYNMAKAANAALYNALGTPKFAGTLATYFAYGTAQGEPGSQPDQGVDNASWLGFLYKNGIIDGYGEVPKDQAFAYAQQFGGAICAQSLSDNAQQQFQSGIAWGQPGDVPDPNEGHDTLLIKTHADGSGSMVTWGAVQDFTPDYFANFVTDVWVIFDADDPSVNWTALQAALDEVHGVVTPIAPVPAPTTAPNLVPHRSVTELWRIGQDIAKIAQDAEREFKKPSIQDLIQVISDLLAIAPLL